MSPLVSIQLLRSQTLHELARAENPIIKSALELQLERLTAAENTERVKVTLSRSAVTHNPTGASIRCGFRFDTEYRPDESHWSFDKDAESAAKHRAKVKKKWEELLCQPIPTDLEIVLAKLGTFKQGLEKLNMTVFEEIPIEIRRTIKSNMMDGLRKNLNLHVNETK